MGWIQLAYAVVVSAAVIGCPGAAVTLPLRLRGLWFAATAPLVGVTVVATASVLASWMHVPWTGWVVAVIAILFAAIVWVAARFIPLVRAVDKLGDRDVRRGDRTVLRGNQWAAPLGVGIAALLLLGRVVYAIGRPVWFAQAGDNVFHLNAVRSILDNGNASPITLVKMGVGTYPDAWHATVALVVQLTGVGIPIASNAMLIVVACALWPLGVVLLTRVFFGARARLIVASGIVSAGFATYPLMLIPYMGTYPLVFSIALLAPALAAYVEMFGIGRGRLGIGAAIVIAILALPGLGDAHPSALVMLAVMTVPLAAAAAWKFARTHRDRRRLAWLVFGLYAVACFAMLLVVRPPGTQPNSLRSTAAQAWGEVLLGAYSSQSIPIVLTALTLLGIVAALRHGGLAGWASVGVWIGVSGIYVTAAVNDEFIHLVFSTSWYGDATRVAAFTPIALVPLAARGADAAWTSALRLIQARVDIGGHRARRIVLNAVAVVLFAALMVGSAAARGSTIWARSMFQPTDNALTSPIPVTVDDRKIFNWVSKHVPQHDLLAGNPWNGVGFAYALTGRPVLVKQMLAPIEGQTKVFLDEFAGSTADGPGCRAARNLGVKWVLDLHPHHLLPNKPKRPGVQGLSDSANVELAYRAGDSAIYRVVGCRVG